MVDPNALYNSSMADPTPGIRGLGGITRIGSPGSFSYISIAGREDLPVNNLSAWDAARFANWLHNGQPVGAQDDMTTEDGAYTLTSIDVANNTVARNEGAEVFLPSEDEWYKAAYYDTGSMSYFDYSTGSDSQPVCAAPSPTANTANCDNAVADLTDVGSYTGSPSPVGTFDQVGNISEWSETAPIQFPANRVIRGASFNRPSSGSKSTIRASVQPIAEPINFGFRVASIAVPEPGSALLNTAAMLALAIVGWFRPGHSI